VGPEYPVLRCALSPAGRLPSTCSVRIRPTALIAAFPMFVSILGEELGWRGFLQDALRPLSPVKRFVLIGVWSPLRIAVTLLISYSAVILLLASKRSAFSSLPLRTHC